MAALRRDWATRAARRARVTGGMFMRGGMAAAVGLYWVCRWRVGESESRDMLATASFGRGAVVGDEVDVDVW